MKVKIVLTCTLAAIIAFNSCQYVNKQKLLQGSFCDTSNIKYSTTITDIMTTYCTTCHGGAIPSAGISLEGYASVKTQVDNGKLWGAVNHDVGFKAMPQGTSKLDPCTLNKIHTWINAGAPNN